MTLEEKNENNRERFKRGEEETLKYPNDDLAFIRGMGF